MIGTFKPYLLILWTIVLMLASASAVQSTLVILGAIFVTPLLLLLSFLWPRRWEFPKRRLKNRLAVPICLALVGSVAIAHWPLKLHYVLAKSKLDKLADQVEAGQAPATPVQVGLFRIKRAEGSFHGITCLWTDLDPSGYTGFVRCAPDKLRFNLWSKVNLDDDWQFISED